MKCPQHPRYGAKHRPKVPCYMCWVKYVKDNPREKFTGREMLGMGQAAVEFEDRMILGHIANNLPVLGRNSIKSKNGLMQITQPESTMKTHKDKNVGVGGED